MRIRQGNDFIFLWTIVRSGIPEDLGNAKNIRLHFKNFDCIGEVKSFQIVDGNVVRVEVSPEWASRLGAYRLILSYEFENNSYSDGDRKCVVDILAFNIVSKTSDADDVTEMTKTTDIMIGFFGLSAYEVWLKDNPDKTKEDYYNWLRQPATDAVSLIDDKIEHLDEVIDSSTENEAERVSAETLRLQSEELRISAEDERKANEVERLANEASRASDELIREANESSRKQDEVTRKTNENERETAELTRQSSESERNENEGLRVNAEVVREQQEQARQTNTATAITNAENAITDVNTAKDDYYDVVKPAIQAQGDYAQEQGDYAKAQGEAIQSDLALKADQADLAQLADDVEQLAYVKIKNEIVNGNFENGLIARFRKNDGYAGVSTLAINSSTPISGNYDIRFTIITPSTSASRPIFYGLHGSANTGDKIYLHFYAKILSGTPNIGLIHNGASVSAIYAGDVINGRNTRIIDVVGVGSVLGVIYFNSRSVWDMQMDNFMSINLTETFGAGNEPTEEEMNLLISTLGTDYFEGEITIPAQKIMQWQLKLIRKNKNAIIALGGTII